jgi:hypothetical protein
VVESKVLSHSIQLLKPKEVPVQHAVRVIAWRKTLMEEGDRP